VTSYLAGDGFPLAVPAVVAVTVRHPVAVLAMVPAAIVEVGADRPDLVEGGGAID